MFKKASDIAKRIFGKSKISKNDLTLKKAMEAAEVIKLAVKEIEKEVVVAVKEVTAPKKAAKKSTVSPKDKKPKAKKSSGGSGGVPQELV